MKKLLLSAAFVAAAGSMLGALPTPKALVSSKIHVADNIKPSNVSQPETPKKITPTPETQWGEWENLGTSTVSFPDDDFF